MSYLIELPVPVTGLPVRLGIALCSFWPLLLPLLSVSPDWLLLISSERLLPVAFGSCPLPASSGECWLLVASDRPTPTAPGRCWSLSITLLISRCTALAKFMVDRWFLVSSNIRAWLLVTFSLVLTAIISAWYLCSVQLLSPVK